MRLRAVRDGPGFRSTTLNHLVLWCSPLLVELDVNAECFPALLSLTTVRCSNLLTLTVDCALLNRVVAAVCSELSSVVFGKRAVLVERVHFRSCDALTEVIWLCSPYVREFSVQHCTVLESTVGFEELIHLQELVLRDNYRLRRLPSAPWTGLTHLDVSYSSVTRLPSLAACHALRTLDVRGCVLLCELPVDLGTTCENLESLLCDSSAVRSLVSLTRAQRLQTCSARACVLLADAEALATCHRLQVVRLCRTPLFQLYPLAAALRSLEWVDVPLELDLGLVEVTVLLSRCPNLVDCTVRNNARLAFFSGLAHTSLETLDARACHHFPPACFNLHAPRLRYLYLSQSSVRGHFSTNALPELCSVELDECVLLESVTVARPLKRFSARHCASLRSVQNGMDCATFSVFGSLFLATG